MKKHIEIIEVEERTSKTGKKYRVCQCIVVGIDGKKRVGEMMVFNSDLELKEGSFIAEFDVTVNFERMVGAELIRLVPFDSTQAGVMAAAKNAAAAAKVQAPAV